LHLPKGSYKDRQPVRVAQVCREVRPPLRAEGGHPDGELIWIQGPYPTGACPDIKIFTSCLAHFLEPGERVEADDGYRGHADKVKCPKNDVNPIKNLKMQGRVRARYETLNGRLKNWGILSQVFRHDIRRHGDVFRECAVIAQLTIENGEPLFEVEYGIRH
jgi:hypothetical protein